ncbi:MAG TPA: DUF2127 domain-containing protein [Opitutaceae bacterium]|nr:DUF2127 domain-containing protein [Opitutaceae bacterium]
MISQSASHKAVRAVAAFEAIKGLVVLCAAFGLLTLIHRDLRALALEIVGRLHLDPTRKYPDIFIEAASNLTPRRLWSFAGFATLYSAFRFLEAYGLWRERKWAEWLALISGGIYLPVEIYGLMVKLTWVRAAAFVANLLVVWLMALVLLRSRARKRALIAAAHANKVPPEKSPNP